MICLALAFIFLILWSVSSTTINHLIINWKPRSLVWLVAAQVTGHPKTLLAGNRFLFILEELSHSLLFSALTFQRLQTRSEKEAIRNEICHLYSSSVVCPLYTFMKEAFLLKKILLRYLRLVTFQCAHPHRVWIIESSFEAVHSNIHR